MASHLTFEIKPGPYMICPGLSLWLNQYLTTLPSLLSEHRSLLTVFHNKPTGSHLRAFVLHLRYPNSLFTHFLPGFIQKVYSQWGFSWSTYLKAVNTHPTPRLPTPLFFSLTQLIQYMFCLSIAFLFVYCFISSTKNSIYYRYCTAQ